MTPHHKEGERVVWDGGMEGSWQEGWGIGRKQWVGPLIH